MKLNRLDTYLKDHDIEAIWFARPDSFEWLVGGDNSVNRSSDIGAAAAGYDGSSISVVTSNIEADRLCDEELPTDTTISVFNWYEESLPEAVANRSRKPIAADFDVPGSEAVDVTTLRQPLTDDDIETYRTLSEDVTSIVETVCRSITPDDTEQEIAARLVEAFVRDGIVAPVVLVGGEDRATKYRHFVPTQAKVGGYALVSVSARRDGLYTSCTRTVANHAPMSLFERHQAAMHVETTAIAATQRIGLDGGTAADVFAVIRSAYESVGFPDEWTRHHQGGAAGYASREWVGSPTLDVPVRLPMAYVWNPTIQGAKSEGTILVTDDSVEILTQTDEWPQEVVEAEEYGIDLLRPKILKLD